MWKLLICCLVVSSVACTGKQKRCTEKTESSFATFLDDEWRAYCDEFEEITENSEAYPLYDVTVFMSDHTDRADDLRSQLAQYDNVDACFKSGKEELEYRKLKSCLRDDAQTEIVLIDAWKTAIDPFLEDLRLTVGSTKPRLREAERSAEYLSNKAKEALNFAKRTNPQKLDEFQELLDTTSEDVARLEDSVDKYDKILEAAEGNETLTEELEKEVSAVVESLRGDIRAQAKTLDDLRDLSGFFQIVEDTAGKACPTNGLAQVKETKIAIKYLRNHFEQIESGRIRIDKRIKSSNGRTKETFSGYACGLRQAEDQFPNTPPLCTVHKFTFTRKKEGRRWGPWKTKKKAGDLEDGIDCKLVN